ncbi:MAG TPA: sigma-54 dependent transcriptional regulator [Ignavibacteriaceae bacterium]
MEKILIIDDEDSILQSLKLYLTTLGYEVTAASNAAEGMQVVYHNNPDLVITDLKMPDTDGLGVLEKVHETGNIPCIIMTAYDDIDSTIKAMQLGAYDYIEKPIDTPKFKELIRRALESKTLSRTLNVPAKEELEEDYNKTRTIGKSSQMKEIFKIVGQVSMNRVTILVNGESGTGKELISRMIHYSGITSEYPFIPVNCSALSESLLESELFGHVRGSFTGAVRDKKGKFELAGRGTIFLDEISEISPDLQVKLLRVIQEREFEKVGGEDPIPMNARIIAATNRNLGEMVQQGKFREDLYYRLKVLTIMIPPLRERQEDIPELAVHFLKKINYELHKDVRKIPYDVMEMLQNYSWTGNVRQLENILLQAVVLSKGDVLEKENILFPDFKKTVIHPDRKSLSLAEVEKEHITEVLEFVNWNKKKAYTILGISKPTLNSKIREYGITRN